MRAEYTDRKGKRTIRNSSLLPNPNESQDSPEAEQQRNRSNEKSALKKSASAALLQTSESLQKEFYIPYLILLGVLYGQGSQMEKARKFYELVQIDLDPHVSCSDKELYEYFIKICEFSTLFLVEQYQKQYLVNL